MKITSKGRVTIPRAIRERFGLLPGTEVQFVVRGNAVEIVKSSGRGEAIVRAMRGRARAGKSTDEILQITRG